MMKTLRYTTGGSENLLFNDEAKPEPGAKEVRIRVVASALNRADTMQRGGTYDPPPGATDVLGLETVGYIEKVGPDCPESVQVGQRIMALLVGGGMAEYVVCRHEQLIQVPDGCSLIQAAAIPEVWLTAYQLLHVIDKVSPNDTVLIHAGAGGVGSALVQLVRQAGAFSIVTAGSQKKIDFVKSLGANVAINYKEENFGERVLELTKGKGVDLLMDSVGATMFDHNVKAISDDGRWILYGLMGGFHVNADLGPFLRKRVQFKSSTLRSRTTEYKGALEKEFSAYALPLFVNGTFKPIVDRVLPFSEVIQAHNLIETNATIGKIILKISEEEEYKNGVI